MRAPREHLEPLLVGHGGEIVRRRRGRQGGASRARRVHGEVVQRLQAPGVLGEHVVLRHRRLHFQALAGGARGTHAGGPGGGRRASRRQRAARVTHASGDRERHGGHRARSPPRGRRAVAATNCGRIAQHAAFSTWSGKSTTTRASRPSTTGFCVRMTSRGPCPTGTDPRARPAVARRTRQLAPRAGRWIRWPPFAPPLPSPPPRRASARTARRIKPPHEARVPSPIAGPDASARRPRARRPPRRPPRRAPRPRTRYAATISPTSHTSPRGRSAVPRRLA